MVPTVLRVDRPGLVHHHNHLLRLRSFPARMERIHILRKLHHSHRGPYSLHLLEVL